jgi:hypothetical protein
MTESQRLLQLAEDAYRHAIQERSLRRGVEHLRFARYFEQLAEAEAWLEQRRTSEARKHCE